MSGRSPAGPLMREHRVIERMLAVLQAALVAMRRQGRVDPALIETATDFIRTYADRCHHGKEEDILFRELAAKDLVPQLADVMAELIEEHTYARKLTRQLIDANRRYAGGEQSAFGEIESAVQGLVEFYPPHIKKEDRHFFKPCLDYFTQDEQAQMLREFDEFDRALIHEKYLAVVQALEHASA